MAELARTSVMRKNSSACSRPRKPTLLQHEATTDLSQRLQQQEGNRRNADMAQQLLTHLNTTRVELKAQTLRNAQLEQEREEGRSSSAAGMEGSSSAPSSVTRSLYSGITSRAALVPVTHDVIQVDTKPWPSVIMGRSQFACPQ